MYTSQSKAMIGNDALEEHDAHYEYYKHGPLARVVLGQQQVQGLDYAYTLQGWLKGVNSMALDTARDMGSDGSRTLSPKDAFGFQLNYFTGDYQSINPLKNPFPGHSAYLGAEYRPLYNGNISSMAVNIAQFNQPQLYNYQYDQLNRIISMDVYRGFNSAANNWNAITVTQDYKERISYDANGNILSYLRNGSTVGGKPQGMDNLVYGYNKDGSGNLQNNKLKEVKDDLGLSGNYTEDIDNQPDNNYGYDAIGNLISDQAEKITNIEWSVYGKILSITKTATVTGDISKITYTYDAAGNRISKKVELRNKEDQYTCYVRDASGNVMAVYSLTGAGMGSPGLTLRETHLYGSSRLGIFNRSVNMDDPPAGAGTANLLGITTSDNFTRGNKFFELSNHLGNVLVTVSDKKPGLDLNGDGLIDTYAAEVITAQDYYPFGMQMVGRKFTSSSSGYRYGFNGKENDNEVKGEGNQQDYGMRIYDPRLGKFLSMDPIQKEYPMLTPYQFASNKPINSIDLDGLEGWELNTPLSNLKRRAVLDNEIESNSRPVFRPATKSNPPIWVKVERFFSDPRNSYYNPSGWVAGSIIWGIVDDSYILFSALEQGGRNATHLNGNKTGEKERVLAFVNVFSIAMGPLLASEEKAMTGGRYMEIPKVEFFDNHELPSKSTLRKFEIPNGDAPAIQMPTQAHRNTGSFANTRLSRQFREIETQLIKEQKFDELWKLVEGDYFKAMELQNLKPNKEAVKLAKDYFFNEVVPKLIK